MKNRTKRHLLFLRHGLLTRVHLAFVLGDLLRTLSLRQAHSELVNNEKHTNSAAAAAISSDICLSAALPKKPNIDITAGSAQHATGQEDKLAKQRDPDPKLTLNRQSQQNTTDSLKNGLETLW